MDISNFISNDNNNRIIYVSLSSRCFEAKYETVHLGTDQNNVSDCKIAMRPYDKNYPIEMIPYAELLYVEGKTARNVSEARLVVDR